MRRVPSMRVSMYLREAGSESKRGELVSRNVGDERGHATDRREDGISHKILVDFYVLLIFLNSFCLPRGELAALRIMAERN